MLVAAGAALLLPANGAQPRPHAAAAILVGTPAAIATVVFAALLALLASRLWASRQLSQALERRTAELERSRAELRLLAHRTEDRVEQERRRIARAVHDELGQALTALAFDMDWLRTHVTDGDGPVRAHLDTMNALLENTTKTVRRIATELRPSVLDDLGLDAAVEWQVSEFARRTGIPADVHIDMAGAKPSPEAATALFRILQEALTNIGRHASARRVQVSLAAADGRAVLEVRDDGVGLPPEEQRIRPSLGIAGMRERAQAVGGGFDVESAPAGGTTVRTAVPFRAPVSGGGAPA